MMATLAAVHTRAGLDLLVAVSASARLALSDLIVVAWSPQEIPEVGGPDLAAEAASAGFSNVVDLNALIQPFHPAQWMPQDAELALLRALLASALGEVDELFLEDVDHRLSRLLARIFEGASVQALAVGLGAYGPPAQRRPPELQQRIQARWHADHLPGVEPVSAEPTIAVTVDRLPVSVGGHQLVIGSDFGAASLGDASVERRAHRELLRAAAPSGGSVVFCPPPLMSPGQLALLTWEARSDGIEVERVGSLVEEWREQGRPPAAFGFTAPALVQLQAVGVAVSAPTVPALLAGLRPYHHRARIELTIVDALLRKQARPEQLPLLLTVVAYLMRPELLPDLADVVTDRLGELSERDRARYLDHGRLVALGLVPRERASRWLKAANWPDGWRRLMPVGSRL
jgi:hypothetical protein